MKVRSSKPFSIPKLILLVLVLAGAVILWYQWSGSGGRSSAVTGPNSRASKEVSQEFQSSVLKVSPAQMREAMAADYRLAPDQRFLVAVAFVHGFLTSRPQGHCEAIFKDGRWSVRYQEMEVGTLPELPDYKDWDSLLTSWVQSILAKHPLKAGPSVDESSLAGIRGSLDSFLAEDSMGALREVDALWAKGQRDSRLVALAARGLVNLSLQTSDTMELADPLLGRAAGVLALAKVLAHENLLHEECLLAYSMGYTAYADEMARSLPVDDPARAFALFQDQALQAAAETGSAESRYLYLLRVAENRDVEDWKSQSSALFPTKMDRPSILRTGLKLRAFETEGSLPMELSPLVLRTVQELTGTYKSAKPSTGGLRGLVERVRRFFGREGPEEQPQSPSLTENFDKAAEALARKTRGVFLDGEAYKAYFAGMFYDSLFVLGTYYLDRLSSIETAQEYSRSVSAKGSGTAGEFSAWYTHLTQAKQGKVDAKPLLGDIARPTGLGGVALRRTLEEIKDRLNYGDLQLFQGTRAIAARFDSRPVHRAHMSHVAYDMLMDLSLAEKLGRSSLEADPHGGEGDRAWMAGFLGDRERLVALLHDPHLDEYSRADAFWGLTTLDGVTDAFLHEQCEQICQETRKSWFAVRAYTKYLNNEKRLPEIEKLLTTWIENHGDENGFPILYAHGTLAMAYNWEGQYGKAWEVMEPEAGSGQAGAMFQTARALEGLGRKEEAERLGRAVVESYPDAPWTRAGTACILWRLGKYDEAADLYVNSPYTKTVSHWAWEISRYFFLAFRDKSDEQALAAFSALLKKKVDQVGLCRIAESFHAAGRHELAFKIHSKMDGGKTQNMYMFPIEAYQYIKAWKGKEAAVAWLAGTKVPLVSASAAVGYLDTREYDLMWDLLPDFEKNPQAFWIWLVRVVAWLKEGAPDNAHKQALVAHFTSAPPDVYCVLARHMLGLVGRDAVWPLVATKDNRCEVAYYVGVLEESRGNLAEASDWYRVSLETGQSRNQEFRWALTALHTWSVKKCALSRVRSRPQPECNVGPLE